jgi:2-methylcitrate dehydratase
MDSLTEKLCTFTTGVTFEKVPTAAVHEAKRRLLDAYACSLGAWDATPPRIARQLAGEVTTSGGSATIWGTRHRTTPDLAAFANGVMTRYLDYNDTYLSLEPAHPSDNIPALVAVAQSCGAHGRDLIAAIIVAYEIQCRFCDAASIRARGWDHVVYGAASVAAAAAKLWGLKGERLAHAIALGANPNVAMRQVRVGQLSHWKGCSFANAARNGVFAADLARRGMTGPADIFSGGMGFFKQVSGPMDPVFWDGKSGEPMILGTYIKFWPAEYHSQSSIDAALQLRPKVGDWTRIAKIDIDSFDAAVDIIGSEPEKWHPTSRETADHSMPYCTAAALVDGDVTLATFAEKRIADAKLHDLIQKVSIHRDAELTAGYPDGIPNRVRVTMADGAKHELLVKYPRGHAKNPMTDEEVVSKFRKLAEGKLTAHRQDEVVAAIMALDKADKVDKLLEALALS